MLYYLVGVVASWLAGVTLPQLLWFCLFVLPHVLIRLVFRRLSEPMPLVHAWHTDEESGRQISLTPPDASRDWRSTFSNLVFGAMHQLVDVGSLGPDTTGVGRTDVTVTLTSSYLESFLALSLYAAQRHLQALRNASISSIVLHELPTQEVQLDRWLLLCQTLGSIPTLASAQISTGSSTISASATATAIRSFQCITHLSLYQSSDARFGDEEYEAIAGALQGHGSLSFLEYCLHARSYHVMLPVVRRLPSLTGFSFSDAGAEGVDGDDVQALATCLVGWTLQGLTLRGLRLKTSNASTVFCNGLAKSQVKAVMLADIHVTDAVMFASALSATQVADMTISNWPADTRDGLPEFLVTLSRNLRKMDRLGKLDLQELVQHSLVVADDATTLALMEPVLPLVIRAAAHCVSLQELLLPYATYSRAMDEALAYLVQPTTSRLKALSVCYSFQHTDESEMCVDYPLFRQAIKTNVILENVQLDFRRHYIRGARPTPWCDDLKQDVAMVTRLNRSGRKYVRDDPTNQEMGYQVLEQVNDDPSCLFFHLKENPALCRPPSATADLVGRQSVHTC